MSFHGTMLDKSKWFVVPKMFVWNKFMPSYKIKNLRKLNKNPARISYV